MIVTLLERVYDVLAYSVIDFDFLEQHDLEIRLGKLVLEFHCVAEYLSTLVVKAIVRRLGQMIQAGLTGFVAGEVVDVQTAIRTIFAFGVLLRAGIG